MVQCPKCSRLNDVPTLGDLENLEDGGIFKIGEGPEAPGKNVLPEATRASAAKSATIVARTSTCGPVSRSFDLGSEEVPLSLKDEERPSGAEIRSAHRRVGRVDSTAAVRSVQASRSQNDPHRHPPVSYAAGDLHLRVTPGTILLHLFQPVNLFVMLFVLFAHVLLQATFSIVRGDFLRGAGGHSRRRVAGIALRDRD